MQPQGMRPGGAGAGAGARGPAVWETAFTTKMLPHFSPFSPTTTSRTNDNALQEVAATAHCVWLSHVPPAPPPLLFSQLPLLSASRLFEPCFPFPSAAALVQTRLSSNYLCGRCSVGDASCNDNQERKREWEREWGESGGERFKALLKPNASQWWWSWAWLASTAVVVCRKWLFCYYVRRRERERYLPLPRAAYYTL